MSKVAIIGAGTIGLSWAELFAASGWDVAIYDVSATAIPHVPGYRIASSIDDAVAGADFVQENGPERLEIKRSIFAEVAAAAKDSAVIASSTSTILPSLLAQGNPRTAQILVGHPYNPPRIMPLVEVVPGALTAPATVERALAVYRSIGKTPVALRKEVPGFVGNRAQKALTDEAKWLVQQGYVTAADFDTILRNSLGLRWAAVGSFEGSHLNGGPNGIRHLMENVGVVMQQVELHRPSTDPATQSAVADQVETAYGTASSYEERVVRRDRITLAVRQAVAREQQRAVLYGLGFNLGSVVRVDPEDGTVSELTSGLAHPDGIVADPASGYAYVTLMGSSGDAPEQGVEPVFDRRDGSIVRVPLTGGNAEAVVPLGTFTAGKQLTTDPGTGRLYWCDREGRGVYRCERDGSGVTALVLTTGRGPSEEDERCVGVAVDPHRGFLYWTQKGASKAGRGRIFRAALEIPEGATAADRHDLETLWENLPEPIDLDLDAEAQVLYWTDRGAGPTGNSLNRAGVPAPQQKGAAPTVLATGFDEAIGLALDTRHSLVYVSDLSGTIRSVDLARGDAPRVVATLAQPATGLDLVWE